MTTDPVPVMIVRQSVATLGRDATDSTRLLIDGPTGTHWTGITVGDLRAVLARSDGQAEHIDKALALHQRWPIYDECGHRHEEGEDGVKLIEEVGYVCEDGFLYAICRACCCDDVYQTEQCVTDHVLPCWPCLTAHALGEDVTP